MAVNTPLKTEEIKPKYEVIEYEGQEARLYADGSIRNAQGHWLAKHPAGTEITHDNAREMLAKRQQIATQRTASWIMKEAQSIDPDVKDEYDAHALMWAKQYTTVIDSDKPRTDDAERVSQAMGTMMRNADLRQTQQAGLPAPQGDDLVMIVMRRRLDAGVVDGEVIPMRSDLQGDAE